MGKNIRHRHLSALLVAALAFGLACERSQPDQPTDSGLPPAEQNIPFHEGHAQAASPDAQPSPADAVLPNPVPFRGLPAHVVPSGTLVTVELPHAFSSTRIHPGETFTAVMAGPLTVNGNILIDRGAVVSVRVESERSQRYQAGSFPSLGYIRLSLSAIDVDGRQLPLQTSSLFVRGLLQKRVGVRIPRGRDLTFRLTAPLALDPEAMAAIKTSAPPQNNLTLH